MQNILAKETMDEMILRQLGAEYVCFHGLQCFVRFIIEEHEISYAYNINMKDKYYLQRIKPYPMAAGVFDNVSDVVNAITIDIEQFKMAVQSGNFEKFLEANRGLLGLTRNLEDLFLYYNVGKEVLNEVESQINLLKKKIINAVDGSERIYFRKDPDTI